MTSSTPFRASPESRRRALRPPGLPGLLLVCLLAVPGPIRGQGPGSAIVEPAHSLPVIATVDVVVAGGTTGAVAAAVAAARTGARVMVIAPEPYLGEDMAGTLRLWLEPGEVATSRLARALHDDPGGRSPVPEPPATAVRPPPRPLHVKQTLDRALVEAGVAFVLGCRTSDVLVDRAGKPAGLVLASRAGRRAVIARVIVDATARALAARLAGASPVPFVPGPREFRRVVIGPRSIVEHPLSLQLPADDEPSWAAVEDTARALTYAPSQRLAADRLVGPAFPVRCVARAEGAFAGAAAIVPGAFRPAGVERLWVVGPDADVSPETSRALGRPVHAIDAGGRIGELAAREALRLADPVEPRVRGDRAVARGTDPVVTAWVRESHADPPPLVTVPCPQRVVPEVGRFDVVVVGGGTSGVAAALGAAWQGRRVCVLEAQHGLGGLATLGSITQYWEGRRTGYTAWLPFGSAWTAETRMEWSRSSLRKAGAQVWLGVSCSGTVVEGNRVRGVVIDSERGRGAVMAAVVIDATGAGDVAAAAGAPCLDDGLDALAFQTVGTAQRDLDRPYFNCDLTWTDETDAADATRALVWARQIHAGSFDVAPVVGSRERRRIEGDVTISVTDELSGRTYADTIALAGARFDCHGPVTDPCLLLRHPGTRWITSRVPLRALLPAGLDGILVVGLGLSARRDALNPLRMQPDVQNLGYAAGVTAAVAVSRDGVVRGIDLAPIRSHLVTTGNLPESVLREGESHPLPRAAVEAAAGRAADDLAALAVVLGHPGASVEAVARAHAAAGGQRRLQFARILAVLGDARGLATLVADVRSRSRWDDGPGRESGRAGSSGGWGQSSLDVTLMALGATGRPEAAGVVIEKLAGLGPEVALAHHRAVYGALERLRDPRAARPLTAALRRPGMGGHAVTTLARGGEVDRELPLAVRELLLARALLACGDPEGLAVARLGAYTHDVRGVLARHARRLLRARSSPAR